MTRPVQMTVPYAAPPGHTDDEENQEYQYEMAWQGLVPETAAVGAPQVLLDVDMHTVQMDDLFGWSRQISLPEASAQTPVQALVGWFDVRFCSPGSEATVGGSAGKSCIELDTSPHAPPTHWAHTTILLQPPLTAPQLSLSLTQSVRSHHDLNITVTHGDSGPTTSHFVTAEFRGSSAAERGSMGDEGDGGRANGDAYDDLAFGD